jgi:hypothetical protein
MLYTTYMSFIQTHRPDHFKIFYINFHACACARARAHTHTHTHTMMMMQYITMLSSVLLHRGSTVLNSADQSNSCTQIMEINK